MIYSSWQISQSFKSTMRILRLFKWSDCGQKNIQLMILWWMCVRHAPMALRPVLTLSGRTLSPTDASSSVQLLSSAGGSRLLPALRSRGSRWVTGGLCSPGTEGCRRFFLWPFPPVLMLPHRGSAQRVTQGERLLVCPECCSNQEAK